MMYTGINTLAAIAKEFNASSASLANVVADAISEVYENMESLGKSQALRISYDAKNEAVSVTVSFVDEATEALSVTYDRSREQLNLQGGIVPRNTGIVFVASMFTYSEQARRYNVSGLNSIYIRGLADLPNNFLIYVPFTVNIHKEYSIYLYNTPFEICYADGEKVSKEVEVANNTVPILFDKVTGKAKLPYSSVFEVGNESDGDPLLTVR